MKVLSIQVGAVQERGEGERPWRTGYYKSAVQGPVRVGDENLEGDGQASRGAHGGPDRVVLAYSADHYPDWRAEMPAYAFPYGAFAENLTMAGLDENTVCIGDRHRIGEVVLEVSMPRSPCGFISRATGVENLLERVRATHRYGWLYRVIQQGSLEAGQEVVVEPGPHAGWTVARVFEVYTDAKSSTPTRVDDFRALIGAERLATAWRERMEQALEKATAAR